MQNMRLSIFFCLFILFLFIYMRFSHATEMESTRFRVDLENLSSQTDYSMQNSNPAVSNVINQHDMLKFDNRDYSLNENPPSLSKKPFIFSLSNANVNFSNIVSSTFKQSSIKLMINPGDIQGSQITVLQEKPFETLSGNIFPNTNCDGGSGTCNKSISSRWISNSAYGFGYSLSTDNKDYYRPFPLKSNNEEEIVLMSNQTPEIKQITINFRLNTSTTQTKGNYKTSVDFVALPKY